MSDEYNEKRLRYDVLMTAIGVVDQQLYWRKESGVQVIAPATSEYINKAIELMAFVDGDVSPATKQLLNETDTSVGC
jgi:hypothetical protein